MSGGGGGGVIKCGAMSGGGGGVIKCGAMSGGDIKCGAMSGGGEDYEHKYRKYKTKYLNLLSKYSK